MRIIRYLFILDCSWLLALVPSSSLLLTVNISYSMDSNRKIKSLFRYCWLLVGNLQNVVVCGFHSWINRECNQTSKHI